MPTKFDPTKPVQTRDGRAARIICTDRVYPGATLDGGDSSIIALVTNDARETVYHYGKDGKINARSFLDHDLINIPEETTVWIAVYNRDNLGSIGYVYETEESARNGSRTASAKISSNVIAILPVTYKEGEGL